MKHGSSIVLAVLVPATLAIAASGKQPKLDVCRVAAQSADWIGKVVRVEGYVVNLGTHGYVLTSGRGCAGRGQLGLSTDQIDGTAIWQKAFASSDGPKRAVLIGKIRWEQARMGGRNPALELQRVESISSREARLSGLS